MIHPLADDYDGESDDLQLVAQAQAGDREALDRLISRHQQWIYNIVLRMLYRRAEAEDATQEILLKVILKLSTFQQRSSFRTWLYRIVVNHVLNVRRARRTAPVLSFAAYGDAVAATPDLDLPDRSSVPADVQLLVEEARVGCTTAMLLCFDDEQRLVYILGEIFGVTDVVGSELLEISRDNYRQKLSRARRDLHSFLHGQCGLVDSANPCRCARKTHGFIQAGYIDPAHLVFAKDRVTYVREVAPKQLDALFELDAAYGEIFRAHPFHESPDFVAAIRNLFERGQFKTIVES